MLRADRREKAAVAVKDAQRHLQTGEGGILWRAFSSRGTFLAAVSSLPLASGRGVPMPDTSPPATSLKSIIIAAQFFCCGEGQDVVAEGGAAGASVDAFAE